MNANMVKTTDRKVISTWNYDIDYSVEALTYNSKDIINRCLSGEKVHLRNNEDGRPTAETIEVKEMVIINNRPYAVCRAKAIGKTYFLGIAKVDKSLALSRDTKKSIEDSSSLASIIFHYNDGRKYSRVVAAFSVR